MLEQKRILSQFLVDIVDYEAPYRHCYYIKNELFLRNMAINNSLNFVIYFGLYSILNKMNLFSLFFWVCMYRILKENFKPNIFKAEVRNSDLHGSAAHYNTKSAYGSPKNKGILNMVYI